MAVGDGRLGLDLDRKIASFALGDENVFKTGKLLPDLLILKQRDGCALPTFGSSDEYWQFFPG